MRYCQTRSRHSPITPLSFLQPAGRAYSARDSIFSKIRPAIFVGRASSSFRADLANVILYTGIYALFRIFFLTLANDSRGSFSRSFALRTSQKSSHNAPCFFRSIRTAFFLPVSSTTNSTPFILLSLHISYIHRFGTALRHQVFNHLGNFNQLCVASFKLGRPFGLIQSFRDNRCYLLQDFFWRGSGSASIIFVTVSVTQCIRSSSSTRINFSVEKFMKRSGASPISKEISF